MSIKNIKKINLPIINEKNGSLFFLENKTGKFKIKRVFFVNAKKNKFESAEKNFIKSFSLEKNFEQSIKNLYLLYLRQRKISPLLDCAKKLINIIRKKIRYGGIIISDDISMKSLKLGLVKNALSALKAGCNLVLYCKGNYKDSIKLLKKIPPIDAFTMKKTSEFYKFLR